MSRKTTIGRREFLKAAGAGGVAVAAFTIVPRHVMAASGKTAPSDKLNIASIGVGGMGGGDVGNVSRGNNMVALCDVDLKRGARSFKAHPQAKVYRDFRKMFDEMSDKIDAVTVSTPDHTHAVAAMAAIKRGKHVYCQKPLAHSVWEVRELMKAAKKHKVVTQLGNQGHSTDSIRNFCEWIWDGAIGKVHTITCACSAVNSGVGNLERIKQASPIPGTLDWDLWQGPAKARPYSPCYLPGAWRGWTPYGNGTIGDWTCHIIDPVFWALDLGAPTSIVAESKGYNPKTQGDAFPRGDRITYEFAGNAKRGPITLHWHSGTEPMPRPKQLEPGRKPIRTGAYVFGDDGVIGYGSHGAGGVRLIPEKAMKAYKVPEKTIPRASEHHRDWLDAIRKGTKAGSDFHDYGGPLTEIAMLGVIALKMPGVKLKWDSARMEFTNSADANQWVKPPYREGWTL